MEDLISHIFRHKEGGAAVAALRLYNGLQKIGVNVESISTNYKSSGNFKLVTRKKSVFIEKVYEKILNQQKKSKKVHAEMLSSPKTDYRVEGVVSKYSEIVHLHWVANFINWPTFFKENKKPLVWTLHDMNPFQGVFHYANDIKVNPNYRKEERLALDLKIQSFRKLKAPKAIVSPSKWLMEASQKSEIFKDLPHYHIPYGLPLDLFRPLDGIFCRDYFKVPKDAFVILFVADSIDNYRKGFDLLLECLPELKQINIHCIAIGKSENKHNGIQHLGSVSDEKLMPIIYNACDAFVLPSREDNLPNTMLEAMACGKPVIAFNTGGMGEQIIDGQNGYLAQEINSDNLATTILRCKNELWGNESFAKQQSIKIRRYAEDNFDLCKQAEKYLEVYKSLK